MLKLLYNAALFLFILLMLPKWLWELLRHRKHTRSLRDKLGLNPFTFTPTKPVIWIHSISVGETKAVAPLVALIQEKVPHFSIVLSIITETGFEEAKRSLKNIAHTFYLPFDFSWIMRRLYRKLKPELLILVEGDFWFNLIQDAPHVALVNGKLSEKSLARFRAVPFFSKPLFRKLDLLCVQSDRFQERFKGLGVDEAKIVVTGNLKFDQPLPHSDKEVWQKKLGLQPHDRVLVIGSTHETEEENLLTALNPLLQQFPNLKIVLAPRHPERFASIAALLKKQGIPFALFSQGAPFGQLLLIDAMGVLAHAYQFAEIAIVGGSFVTHVGGHNIFEPAALGVPVLFGPYMEAQKDLVELVVGAGAGRQVTLQEVAPTVSAWLRDPPVEMQRAGKALREAMHGATLRTWEALEPLLRK